MRMNENRKDWITTGLTIMTAIMVFRIVSGVGEAAWLFLRKIPHTLAMQVHSFGFVVIPAISIAVAVLTCRHCLKTSHIAPSPIRVATIATNKPKPGIALSTIYIKMPLSKLMKMGMSRFGKIRGRNRSATQ